MAIIFFVQLVKYLIDHLGMTLKLSSVLTITVSSHLFIYLGKSAGYENLCELILSESVGGGEKVLQACHLHIVLRTGSKHSPSESCICLTCFTLYTGRQIVGLACVYIRAGGRSYSLVVTKSHHHHHHHHHTNTTNISS